ncbi:hypothetical protein SAMN06295912_13538 [Sphingomonas laterariae]|uniref:Uncharacterized protein n=1 Tax=Edaphosphingomonas laterariae TaxID=861865 RepID=A0A239JKX7_9SPHN|nr:hypothetical protein SAMN06295912_13538 [Sphingomonas laterariae]
MKGLHLTRLYERTGPDGRPMLTGKLGRLVFVGILEDDGVDSRRCYRMHLVEPVGSRTGVASSFRHEHDARLAARAATAPGGG